MKHVVVPPVPCLQGLPMDQACRNIEQWFYDLRQAVEALRDQTCQCGLCVHMRAIRALEVSP